MEKYLLLHSCQVSEAIDRLKLIPNIGFVVVDEENFLQGTLTDGDIRRWLLKGGDLSAHVAECINPNPITSKKSKLAPEKIIEYRERYIRILPYIDESNKVLDCIIIPNNTKKEEVPVVIMAGGLGSRLGDLTAACPKPMLKISGKPILEIIINALVSEGFKKIYLSVNYLSTVIEDYFEDGTNFGCEIKYVHEEKKMGTAGSLRLIKDLPEGPVVVMNGDILTQTKFSSLLDFHVENKDLITVGARKYDVQVPFGVIDVSKELNVKGIVEKPVHEFFVSGGVYVLDSSVIKLIPSNEFYDMPTLINEAIRTDEKVGCYPIHEEWIDIGRKFDLDLARDTYEE